MWCIVLSVTSLGLAGGHLVLVAREDGNRGKSSLLINAKNFHSLIFNRIFLGSFLWNWLNEFHNISSKNVRFKCWSEMTLIISFDLIQDESKWSKTDSKTDQLPVKCHHHSRLHRSHSTTNSSSQKLSSQRFSTFLGTFFPSSLRSMRILIEISWQIGG